MNDVVAKAEARIAYRPDWGTSRTTYTRLQPGCGRVADGTPEGVGSVYGAASRRKRKVVQ